MDLNAPLGLTPTPRPRRGAGLRLGACLGAAVVAAGGIAAWLFTANPRGGEPYAVATIARPPRAEPPPIEPSPKLVAAVAPDLMPTGSVAARRPAPQAPADTGADAATTENGVKVFRGVLPGGVLPSGALAGGMSSGGSPPQQEAISGGPLVIDVSKTLDGAKTNNVSKTIDVPKGVGGDPVTRGQPAASAGAKPRVAIFVGGMGLGAAATREAIDTMPAAVTLAFIPTGDGFANGGLAAAVDAARSKGHEVLLQLPMESAAVPADGPRTPGARGLGSHGLTAGEAPGALKADMAWLLGRFKGYDGVTNLLGAAVTEAPATMTGVLKAVGERGLFYVDDGTSRRSLATALAPGLGVPSGRADVVLDATADPAVVRANLDALVTLARRRGTAIGMASGLPDHLAAIADYANGLGQRGVELVPVGTLARAATDVAAAR